MTVEKTFGFGNSSPYRSATFNKNNELIFGKNGLLEITSIKNDGTDVVLEDVTFIQQGVIVKSLGTVNITFPVSLPSPFYLIATIPDTRPTDNIAWGFVRRPQDIGENTVLLAEWDGQEWRPISKMTFKALLEARLQAAKAYDNIGFNTGFRFKPDPTFSNYTLTEGVLTDQAGQLTEKLEESQFSAITDDLNWNRIDVLAYRRLKDDPNRIGHFILRPGNTYSGSSITSLYETSIGPASEVKSNPKIIVQEDNSFLMLHIEDYGANGKIIVTKYAEDRQTVLNPASTLVNGVQEFDAVLDKDGNTMIVFSQDGNLFRMKINSSGGQVLGPATIETLTNPSLKPVIKADFIGNYYIMFLYQAAPTTFTPYFIKLNSGGAVATPAKLIINNTDEYVSIDFHIDQDFIIHSVYGNNSTKAVELHVLDEIGDELEAREIVSDEVDHNGVLQTGFSVRNTKIHFTENHELYISWEQSKSISQYGFVLYNPNYKKRFGSKALMLDIDGPTENITDHEIALDWNNHAFILVNNEGELRFYKYFLPELGSRLPGSLPVKSNQKDGFDIVYDKKGSLILAFADKVSGTTSNGTPVTTGKFGSATYGAENVFVNSDEIAFPLADLSTLPEVPTFGDSVSITGSTEGNNGAFNLISQRDVLIDATTYRIFRLDSASFTAEEATGVQGQFERLDGNALSFRKQTSAIAYDFSEVQAEIVNTDIVAVMINTFDNSFLAWYQQVSASGDDNTLRGEAFLMSKGNIDWDKDLDGGTLTWAEDLHVVDPYRNEFTIPAGSINHLGENQILHIMYPRTEFLTEDGASAGIKVASVVDISQFYVGQKVFLGDSDSAGIQTTVTGVTAGEISVADNITQFSKIRGAYIIPVTVQILKEDRNTGALKPNSLGDVNTQVYTIAARKDNLVTFRAGSLTLEHGESGNIGDGVPEATLAFMGAKDEADSSPDFTNALGAPIANIVLVDGENLTKAIKRLETKSDTATVNYVDIVSEILPTGISAIVDGNAVVDDDTVLFVKSGIEGIYQVSGVGTAIVWTALNLFNGLVTPLNGSLVKVIGGNTDYFQTIWERRLDYFAPLQVRDATSEPSGFREESLDDAILAFDEPTRTFSITPTGDYFDYFIKGQIHRKNTVQEIVIPDVTALYFFYFNGANLIVDTAIDIELAKSCACVAVVYWHAEDGKMYGLGERRYGIVMPWATKHYLYRTRGASLSEGFDLGTFTIGGDGSADEHAQFSISGGILHNEDIEIATKHANPPVNRFEQILEPQAQCAIYYRKGPNGVFSAHDPTTFAVAAGVARPQVNIFNGTTLEWETPDVSNDGKFFSMWVFSTNGYKNPVLIVMGQAEYDLLEDAQAEESYTNLNLGEFPSRSWKVCHRLIFQADTSYGNSVKARLMDATDIRYGEDSLFPSSTSNDHGRLTGLNDPDHGPTAVTTELVEKDGGLSELDIDLKDVMNMLNRYFGQMRLKEHPTNKKRVVITGAERILNDGTVFGQTISGYMMKFEGAEIDFSTGSIYASDGTTPIGIDFVPEPTALGEFRWHSVAIAYKEETTDVQASVQVLVRPSLNAAISAATAEKAQWTEGTPIGQVIVEGEAGGIADIAQEDLFWLGLGSGGGGSSSGGSGVGASYKNRAYSYTDGSQEEFNMQPPTFNASTGYTELALDFEILDGEVVRVHVGQQNYTQFISETVTPELYWRMLTPLRMEIKGDITTLNPAENISIEVLEGVEVAPVPPTYLAGLELTHEAYGYTDGTGGSIGVTSISVVGGKTQIVLSKEVKPSEIVNVFVDNEYFPPCVETILETKCHRIVDFQTIELDGDYSVGHTPFYLAVYEGMSHVDSMGNVEITLRPTIEGIVLQSPDTNRWKVYASNEGEAVTETVSVGTPDPVHVYNEDGIIVQLLIDDEGNLYTENPPTTPGIVFEQLHLGSENGLAWKVHVLGATPPETEGVLQLRDGVGNKWVLLDQLGEIIHQVSQTAEGAIIDTQYILENDLVDPTEENGTITWAMVMRPTGPVFALWNTYTNEWELTGGKASGFVGDVAISFFEEDQFQTSRDDSWVLADGRNTTGSKWHEITGNPLIPDMRGLAVRGKNNGREGTFANPDGDLPLASGQLDEVESHNHKVGSRDSLTTYGTGNTMEFVYNYVGGSSYKPSSSYFGGNETRMKNITVNYFIKIND